METYQWKNINIGICLSKEGEKHENMAEKKSKRH